LPLRPLTLLLLSGGGLTGSNIMACLAKRRAGLRLVATTDRPGEPALFNFDVAYLAPRLVDEVAAFERRVLDILERESVDLVVPCRDEDVTWLAGLGERRTDLAPKFLCGSREAAEIANDKWLSFEFCERHALPFAPTLLCGDTANARSFVEEHGFPLVAKPRHGVDAKGIVLLTEFPQVMRAMQRPDYVLQKFLGAGDEVAGYLATLALDGIPLVHSFQGNKRSLQVLIGPDQSLRQIVCTRNFMTGQATRSITIDRAVEPGSIGARCALAFAGAAWRGPLNIQCQPAPNGELMIHEFNVRFTGATAARLELGIDEVGAAIAAFTGRRIADALGWRDLPEIAFERFSVRSADGRNVRTLAERGEWRRALQ
jgi:carbamoylphosphate synthase large subunit